MINPLWKIISIYKTSYQVCGFKTDWTDNLWYRLWLSLLYLLVSAAGCSRMVDFQSWEMCWVRFAVKVWAELHWMLPVMQCLEVKRQLGLQKMEESVSRTITRVSCIENRKAVQTIKDMKCWLSDGCRSPGESPFLPQERMQKTELVSALPPFTCCGLRKHCWICFAELPSVHWAQKDIQAYQINTDLQAVWY